MAGTADHREWILECLRDDQLPFVRLGATDEYVSDAAARARFLHRPVLTMAPDVLADYVQQLSRPYSDRPDALQEAVSMAALHVVESLTADHGDGRNTTTALGFRRTARGSVEFFVEDDRPSDDGAAEGEPLEWVADRPAGPDQR